MPRIAGDLVLRIRPHPVEREIRDASIAEILGMREGRFADKTTPRRPAPAYQTTGLRRRERSRDLAAHHANLRHKAGIPPPKPDLDQPAVIAGVDGANGRIQNCRRFSVSSSSPTSRQRNRATTPGSGAYPRLRQNESS